MGEKHIKIGRGQVYDNLRKFIVGGYALAAENKYIITDRGYILYHAQKDAR